MQIWDIFSSVKDKELPLKTIEEMFTEYFVKGLQNADYKIVTRLPEFADANCIDCSKYLLCEGKQVAYLIYQKTVVAVIGYK